MGFVTSFLIIIIAGFWSYHLHHRFGLSKGHKAFIAWYALIVVGGLMILDFLIYIGLLDFVFPILNQLPWVSIDNGVDFMWNSFQLIGFDWGIDYTQPGLTWMAILLFFTYPMWFKFFSNGSRMLFGGKPYQFGIWYMIEPTRKPKKGEKIAAEPSET